MRITKQALEQRAKNINQSHPTHTHGIIIQRSATTYNVVRQNRKKTIDHTLLYSGPAASCDIFLKGMEAQL